MRILQSRFNDISRLHRTIINARDVNASRSTIVASFNRLSMLFLDRREKITDYYVNGHKMRGKTASIF